MLFPIATGIHSVPWNFRIRAIVISLGMLVLRLLALRVVLAAVVFTIPIPTMFEARQSWRLIPIRILILSFRSQTSPLIFLILQSIKILSQNIDSHVPLIDNFLHDFPYNIRVDIIVPLDISTDDPAISRHLVKHFMTLYHLTGLRKQLSTIRGVFGNVEYLALLVVDAAEGTIGIVRFGLLEEGGLAGEDEEGDTVGMGAVFDWVISGSPRVRVETQGNPALTTDDSVAVPSSLT
ncbi:hypothetical protein BGZ57DRAFT_92958 [Hyaloscypha finlandica]|nr:hypothetical protein BGZ57DRAFT_92958 [Hyaloscypha finlandica]